MPADLDRALARVENLDNERRDRAFEALSGGLIRLFAQVTELQAAYRAERAELIQLRKEFDQLRDHVTLGAADTTSSNNLARAVARANERLVSLESRQGDADTEMGIRPHPAANPSAPHRRRYGQKPD
jgi:hypothetical protein